MQTEHAKYFEALQQHPRSLVGQEVPKADGSGMERLKDSADAREWQEQIKLQLAQEVKSRASHRVDEVRPMLETVHQSVAIFQNNPDMIPGARQFDRELANTFAEFVKDFEVRVEDKLVGYSIPVQPIINRLRTQLTTTRAAAGNAGGGTAAPAAAPSGPTAQQQRAAGQARTPAGQFTNPDAPQAGFVGAAGGGDTGAEDFSTLFATLSPALSGMRI